MKITAVRVEVYQWPMTEPIRNGLYTYTHSQLNIVFVVAPGERPAGLTGAERRGILAAQGTRDAPP